MVTQGVGDARRNELQRGCVILGLALALDGPTRRDGGRRGPCRTGARSTDGDKKPRRATAAQLFHLISARNSRTKDRWIKSALASFPALGSGAKTKAHS